LRTFLLLILLFPTSIAFGDDFARAVPAPVRGAGAAVVAVRWSKKEELKQETFRQRWNRRRKEKFGAMNQKGDGSFGAGFFIDADGHILTTLGLTQKGVKIEVMLPGGELLPATLLATDKRNDIAILKVARKGNGEQKTKAFPFLTLSDDLPQAGQTVYSMGNSFKSVETDLQVAISRGQVTSVFAVVKGTGRYRGTALETNASTNPGDYGGPLLNRKGQVVGLLSSGYLSGRKAGLAIPAHQVKKLLPRIMKGETYKPYFGIEVKVRAKDGVGVPIQAVRDDFPGARAGLSSEDLILSVNGVLTNNAAELKRAILTFPAYSDVELLIKKSNGKRMKVMLRPAVVSESGVKGM
jgi:S1-C subfamily serine protease